MSNATSEQMQKTKLKGKPGFNLKEIITGEKALGSSEKNLGACWGVNPSKLNPAGRTTQRSVQSQSVTGTIEPTQEEDGACTEGQ